MRKLVLLSNMRYEVFICFILVYIAIILKSKKVGKINNILSKRNYLLIKTKKNLIIAKIVFFNIVKQFLSN